MIPLYRYWDKHLKKYQPVAEIDFGFQGSHAVGYTRVHLPEGGCMGGDYWEVAEPECIEQFTLITDKNEKRIFEGDIVRITLRSGTVITGYVYYDDLTFKLSNDSILRFFALMNSKKMEIIGNIHENPELLRNQK